MDTRVEIKNFTTVRECYINCRNFIPLFGNRPKKFNFAHQTETVFLLGGVCGMWGSLNMEYRDN